MYTNIKKVALIGGLRTPFAKAGTMLKQYSSLDLGSKVVEESFKRLNIEKNNPELYFGNVLLNPRFPNLAREIVLRTSLPKSTNAHFVSNNCITGLVAINSAFEGILSGRIECSLAGGVESMSQPTLTFSKKAENFWLALHHTKGNLNKVKALLGYKPKYIFPVPPSPKEPSTGLTMGEHCELMAKEWGVKREEQDKYAFFSHKKGALGKSSGFFEKDILEINGIKHDNLIREDTTLEKLGKLQPSFDRSSTGTLTPGNSSSLTDGASCTVLMDLELAKASGREDLITIEGIEFASVSPDEGLLMAPVIAVHNLLNRFNLQVKDIGVFEIHEAFAAQVLSNLKAWQEGWTRYPLIKRLGEIPEEKINIYGGSLTLGHPFAATGGRLLLNIRRILKAKNQEYGVISVCAAGGMGGAVLVRNV